MIKINDYREENNWLKIPDQLNTWDIVPKDFFPNPTILTVFSDSLDDTIKNKFIKSVRNSKKESKIQTNLSKLQ